MCMENAKLDVKLMPKVRKTKNLFLQHELHKFPSHKDTIDLEGKTVFSQKHNNNVIHKVTTFLQKEQCKETKCACYSKTWAMLGNHFLKFSSGLEVLSKKINIQKREITRKALKTSKNWKSPEPVAICGFGVVAHVPAQGITTAIVLHWEMPVNGWHIGKHTRFLSTGQPNVGLLLCGDHWHLWCQT